MARISTPRPSAPAQPGPHDLQGRPLWPTMFFRREWKDHGRHAPSIIAHLRALRDASTRNIASGIAEGSKSREGLFESTLDLFETTEQADLKTLVAWIDESVRQAVSMVNGRQVDPSNLRVTFTDSWAHITNGGGFHDSHYHGGCSWCGIYYLQAGESATSSDGHAGNGVNRYYAPIAIGGLVNDYGNHYLGKNSIDVPPRDGVLMLFPSYMLHAGLPYTGATDRILLAFNTLTNVIED